MVLNIYIIRYYYTCMSTCSDLHAVFPVMDNRHGIVRIIVHVVHRSSCCVPVMDNRHGIVRIIVHVHRSSCCVPVMDNRHGIVRIIVHV